MAFSPDGQLLASASPDGSVRLWDPSIGLHSILDGRSGPIEAVAFRPDGRLLASASEDCNVRLWDPTTGALRRILEGHLYWVLAVAFRPDGQLLASSSIDGTVRLWDPTTGALRSILSGHSGWTQGLAFSLDGQLLASSSLDNEVRLWHTQTGEIAHCYSTSTMVSKLCVLHSLHHSWYARLCQQILEHPHPPHSTPNSAFTPSRGWYVNSHWVKWGTENVLYLPADHRPSAVAVRQNLLVIGHVSGRISFIELDPGLIPLGVAGGVTALVE